MRGNAGKIRDRNSVPYVEGEAPCNWGFWVPRANCGESDMGRFALKDGNDVLNSEKTLQFSLRRAIV